MRKAFKLENLDCANCASKMEADIAKLKGVNRASISFMTSKLMMDVDEGCLGEVLEQAQGICARYEPDCRIVA